MSNERCHACFRPRAQCVCAQVPAVDNRTTVRLLQHPREARHPFGTASLLRASLTRIEIDVGVRHAPPDSLDGVALLWPSPGAPAAEQPTTLIAIDGTWPHARAIRTANPWLAKLPVVSIAGTRGGYRARREADDEGLATVEAVAFALERLEPELANVRALVDVFHRREATWARAPKRQRRRRNRRRATTQRSALARIEDAAIGFRSGHTLVVARLDDPTRMWRGTIDGGDHRQLDALLAGANALWAWRAEAFRRLAHDVPVLELKTLHRQRGGHGGGVFGTRPSLEAGLAATAALLRSFVDEGPALDGTDDRADDRAEQRRRNTEYDR